MAQLGARFHGMEEVVGSIPTRSTKFSTSSAHLFRCMEEVLIAFCSFGRASFFEHKKILSPEPFGDTIFRTCPEFGRKVLEHQRA